MNNKPPAFYRDFETRFTRWAQANDDVRTAFIIGSQARKDHPADAWSDLDILMFANTPERYLAAADWLAPLGNVLCTFPRNTDGGDPERLTLFEGGYQVDFVVALTAELHRLAAAGQVHGNFHRGVKVLFDKEGVAQQILPKEMQIPYQPPLSAEGFTATGDMFWFCVLYIAKQILRGELWVAKMRDCDLKAALLQMIIWHAQAAHGTDYDTWHAGRFMAQWADADVLEAVGHTFAGFTQQASWDALLATAALFARLSHQLASRQGYPLPQAETVWQAWLTAHQKTIAQTLA